MDVGSNIYAVCLRRMVLTSPIVELDTDAAPTAPTSHPSSALGYWVGDSGK